MTVKEGIISALQVRWRPNRDTAVALALGLLVLATSAVLPVFMGSALGLVPYVFLRDVLMVGIIGLLAPVYYTLFIKGRGIGELGITKKKWLASIAIGAALALLFLFVFIGEAGQEGRRIFLDPAVIGPVFYLMLVGVFEVVFFYVFLRQQFEEAFGVLPGVVLAAAFYSLHHAGFQPEFVKLFFVGMLYGGVFRLTLNLLAIYPLFWGVGGCWDVLVRSDAVIGPAMSYSGLRGLLLLVLMALGLAFIYRKLRKISTGVSAGGKKTAGLGL